MCESGHLESESRCLKSESRWIQIHFYFLECESKSQWLESRFESDCPLEAPLVSFEWVCEHWITGRQAGVRILDAVSESTLYFLYSIPDWAYWGLNRNPNPAQKDSCLHVTGLHSLKLSIIHYIMKPYEIAYFECHIYTCWVASLLYCKYLFLSIQA